MESFVRDIKHALRMFRHSPSFTAAAIAALGLGIGMNTAIFSVVNAVLLKPVRAPKPERVVTFISTNREDSSPAASEIEFNIWREQTSVLQDVSAYYYGFLNLTDVDQPQRANAMYVTTDYFPLFGLSVAHGHNFTEEEQQPNGPKAIILSDAFWQRAFDCDPGVIGRAITLSGHRYRVVGIMPHGVATETPKPIDVWLPFGIDPNSNFQGRYFGVAARLKAGVTLDMANAQLKLATQEFRRKFPNSISTRRGDVFSVEPMREALVKGIRSSLLILAGAVLLVLLIACANVANLLLVKAVGRIRDIAVRLAVGASRSRIIRQLLTESVLLSLAGAGVGLMLGLATIRGFLALNAANLPRIGVQGENVSIDWRVLAFTVAIALVTGLVFGAIPAFQSSRIDLNSSLKDNERTGTGSRQNRTRSLLVVSEMSLALLLLIGAALLIRSLISLWSVDPGFDPSGVITTRTSLDPRSANKSRAEDIVQDAFRRLSALRGVESVGYTRLLPLDGGFNNFPVVATGRPRNRQSHGFARWVVISPSYFDVLKIPLMRGRYFADTDRQGSPLVAIINKSMARRLWPNGGALNDRVVIGKGLGPNVQEPPRQIVGIVGDVHENGLGAQPQPAIFVPGAQLPDNRRIGRSVAWVIRTRTQSPSLKAAVANELRGATGEPVPRVRTMDEVMLRSTARQELNMLLMSTFAGTALLLAAIGIYGLVSYTAQQRTHEIGVRMALGAQAGDIRRMLLADGMRLALIGIGVGVLASLGLMRFLSSFLFGVRPLDPIVFIGTPILLGLVALAAIWLPVRRACRLDPSRALHHD